MGAVEGLRETMGKLRSLEGMREGYRLACAADRL